MIASPPLAPRRGRARRADRDRQRLGELEQLVDVVPPRPRRPPRSARGRSAGRRRARRCGPRRRARPPASCRPSAPTTRHARSRAHAASPSHSRGPPSSSRYSAIGPDSVLAGEELQVVGGRATAWLPLATPCGSAGPRRVASALTATLPLCEISATAPGSRGASASPHSAAARVHRDDPVAVRAAHRQPVPRRRRDQRRPAAATPSGDLREAGAEHDRAAAAARAGLLDHRRHARRRDRHDHRVDGDRAGRRRVGTHGRPSTSVRLGLTPHTGPGKPIASRFSSACAAVAARAGRWRRRPRSTPDAADGVRSTARPLNGSSPRRRGARARGR